MRTTTTIRSTSWMAILACMAAATASCAQVEADVPEAEVTQKAVNFLGIPGGSNLGEVSTLQTFTLSSDNLSWAKDMNADVYATEVEFRANGSIQDLSFIHYARVTMSDAATDSTTQAVEIINYERPANTGATPMISVKTSYPIDVTKVWAAKKIMVTMSLAGVFPEQTWSADVTLHLGGKFSYKL
jgi:hypothetical protein